MKFDRHRRCHICNSILAIKDKRFTLCSNLCRKAAKKKQDKKYAASEKGRIQQKRSRLKWGKTEKFKEYFKKYRKSKKGKEKDRRYWQSEKGKLQYSKMRKKHFVKFMARYILNKNITLGKIQKINFCSMCGKSNCRIEGHHYNYSEPLLVEWLCKDCHTKKHRSTNEYK